MADLTSVLQEWAWDGTGPKVRQLTLPDGRTVIQVRVELGILQMEATGRPDGARPNGHESVLAELMAQPEEEPLTPEQAEALRAECVLYQQRSAAFAAVGRPGDAARDSHRNVEASDLVRKRAARPQDRAAFEQMRVPFILMRARSAAAAAVRAGDGKAAVAALDHGLAELKESFAVMGMAPRFDGSPEAAILRSMRELLTPKLPSSQRAELEERLRRAVASENYELAAILRNELRQMREGIGGC